MSVWASDTIFLASGTLNCGKPNLLGQSLKPRQKTKRYKGDPHYNVALYFLYFS